MKLQEQLAQVLKRYKGWLNFLGVVNIIGGILYSLSLIGIIFGILMIFIGIKLINAAQLIQRYINSRDEVDLLSIHENLAGYFKYTGILYIVSIIIGIFILLIYFIIIVSFSAPSNPYWY